MQEMAMMQQLRHRHLIEGIDGWIEKKHTAWLVMEICGGGDLAGFLEARAGQKLHEDDINMMLVQVPHPAREHNQRMCQ